MKYSIPNVAKSIGAALATVGVVAGALLANSTFTHIIPAWAVAILTSLVAAGIVAGVVFGIPNAQTPEQLQKAATDAGLAVGTAVSAAVIERTADAVENTVRAVTPDVFDGPVHGAVEAISGQARRTVEDLLNNFKLVVPR